MPRSEAFLLAKLAELGGGVIRPAEATGLRVGSDSVTAEIVMDGRPHTVEAAWVVGCDGMHSLVRDDVGIPFKGAAYLQSFVLADVYMDWPLSRDEVSLFFAPEGLVVVAPLPENRYRVVATVDEAPEHPTVADMQALLDARGPRAQPARIHEHVWSSRFRLHHRVAESPRKGRVLLCGDAAHVHSPAGGQGMNTGIQDAISLAGLLADVIEGADATVLDAWAAARHDVAADVVALTDRLTRVATVGSPAIRTVRNAAMRAAGHLPFLTRALARKLAELEATRGPFGESIPA